MKIYYAGGESYPTLLMEHGATRVLCSYYYMIKGKSIPGLFKNELIDSGGFTARKFNIEINIGDYVDFLNRYKVKFAFNLDTNDPIETQENQKILDRETGSYIIPIYHLQDWANPATFPLLDEFIEDYPYIAIGGIAGKKGLRKIHNDFYNYVFSKTKDQTRVHGLGITGKRLLMKYPFYSVDSASWISVSKFGSWLNPDEMKKYYSALRRRDPDKRKVDDNLLLNLSDWDKFQYQIKRLWEIRGIKWKDLDHVQAIAETNRII